MEDNKFANENNDMLFLADEELNEGARKHINKMRTLGENVTKFSKRK